MGERDALAAISAVLCAHLALLALLPAGEPAPTLVVMPVRASQPGASCQPSPRVVQAIARRLPGLRVAEGAKIGPDDLGLGFVQGGQRWRLELRRPSGDLALVRDLGQPSCGDLAEIGAAIVERYLTELRWSGVEGALAARQDTARVRVETSATDAATPGRLTVDAGLTALFSAPISVDPAATVEAGLRLSPRWRLSASLVAATSRQVAANIQGADRAQLTSRPFLATVDLAAIFPARRLQWSVGLAAGAAALHGQAAPIAPSHIYAASPRVVVAPVLGPALRAVLPFGRGLELVGAITGAVPLWRAQVQIEGTTARRSMPLGYGTASLGLGWRFL